MTKTVIKTTTSLIDKLKIKNIKKEGGKSSRGGGGVEKERNFQLN